MQPPHGPADLPSGVRLFPLPGVLLLPRAVLPLNIFEPRYLQMVRDAMAGDRMIAMIQPRPGHDLAGAPPLFDIGCVGKIEHVEALDDGRYNIILEGTSRFRVVRELEVTTAFRQIEGKLIATAEHDDLDMTTRAALEIESKRFAEAQGYAVDWTSVGRLDDEAFVNGIAQVAPFDAAAKQVLLEAEMLAERAELIMQLLRFFGRHDGDDRVTLQ